MSKRDGDPLNDLRKIGRDPDGHRWHLTVCRYCGITDPRMVAVENGHEPEILLASISSCKSRKAVKEQIDIATPMSEDKWPWLDNQKKQNG